MRRRRNSTHFRLLAILTFIVLAGLYCSVERFNELFFSAVTPPPVPVPAAGTALGRWEFQNADALKAWEEKVFKGKTLFETVPDNEGGYLQIESQNACSGLYMKVKTEGVPELRLIWRWRAREFPKKKKHVLSDRGEDDFAARVYVIFPAANFFHSDAIEYIWDETLPAGSLGLSPYSDRIHLLVLQRGSSGAGEGAWRKEERNVYADYRKLFGHEPSHPLGLIAFMSDSDSTRTSAAADFGAVTLRAEKRN